MVVERLARANTTDGGSRSGLAVRHASAPRPLIGVDPGAAAGRRAAVCPQFVLTDRAQGPVPVVALVQSAHTSTTTPDAHDGDA